MGVREKERKLRGMRAQQHEGREEGEEGEEGEKVGRRRYDTGGATRVSSTSAW